MRSFTEGLTIKTVTKMYFRGCLRHETGRPVGPKPETGVRFLDRGAAPTSYGVWGL